ncbi:hypothetical protein VaNZ11_008792 [Volvox africanus]|uniref:Uncharacterized protein n=1 Tax=Volvox africanus TaxID=51714 RepID=A0ABQ5S771_9CHLO|nr:hypothetical protein VaNZ11_008792 [Volvox africanus]
MSTPLQVFVISLTALVLLTGGKPATARLHVLSKPAKAQNKGSLSAEALTVDGHVHIPARLDPSSSGGAQEQDATRFRIRHEAKKARPAKHAASASKHPHTKIPKHLGIREKPQDSPTGPGGDQ